MAVIINPSVNINIVYSTEHDYEYLINEGIASQGDLIIESVSNDGNGVIHIQDTDFYLSGFAIYKNGTQVSQSHAAYIKLNTYNPGDIGFEGLIYAMDVSANTVSFSTLAYNKTGKQLINVIEGLENIPWKLQFERNVYPAVDDLYINGKLFSLNYLTQEDVSLLFQTKDAANIQASQIQELIYNTSTYILNTQKDADKRHDTSIRNIDASIAKITSDLRNTSAYYYSTPTANITQPSQLDSIKGAIDTLVYDKFYTPPADVSVICTINPSTFIKGKRPADGIQIGWRMVNYITEAEFRAFTKQNFNGTITSNLYTYSTTISPTEIVNATSDIQRYLIISNTHKDLKGNEPKSFVYTYVAKMIVEEYYYTSASESISNINTFTNNMVPIQFLTTDDGYKKFVCEIGSTPQYVYLVLENTDMPAFYIYESDDNGILGGRSIEGGITKLYQQSLTKYNKPLVYTIFRTCQKLTGNICIQYK